MAARPCAHNNWEDLRGRRQYKSLRCFDCGARWQVFLPRCGGWCRDFHQSGCVHGAACHSVHVTGRSRTANARAALIVSTASHNAQDDSLGGSTPDHDAQAPHTRSSQETMPALASSTSDDVPVCAPHDSTRSFDNTPSGGSVSPQGSLHPNDPPSARNGSEKSKMSGSIKVRMTGDTEWNQLEIVYPEQAPWMMTEGQLDAMLRAHGLE